MKVAVSAGCLIFLAQNICVFSATPFLGHRVMMNHHSTEAVNKGTWPDIWMGHPQAPPPLHVVTVITCLPNLFLLLQSLLQLIANYLVTTLKTWVSSNIFPSHPPASFSPCVIHKIGLTLPQKHPGAHHFSPPPRECSLVLSPGLWQWLL